MPSRFTTVNPLSNVAMPGSQAVTYITWAQFRTTTCLERPKLLISS
jgi:hypothetical protein